MYFKGVANRSIVIDRYFGLGSVLSVTTDSKLGRAITVLFGRPPADTKQCKYDLYGRRIDNGAMSQDQMLFYADDAEVLEITATIKKTEPVNVTMLGELRLREMVFDIMYGWGIVSAISPTIKAFTVDYALPGGMRQASYDENGRGIGTLVDTQRVFTRKDIANETFAKVMNDKLNSKDCPVSLLRDNHSLRYVTSQGINQENDTKQYIFFYKPKKTSGFLQNIMIGTGSGKTIYDALDNLYRKEAFGHPTSRGEAFDAAIRDGKVDRIFGYECTHLTEADKDAMIAIRDKFDRVHHSNPFGSILAAAVARTCP